MTESVDWVLPDTSQKRPLLAAITSWTLALVLGTVSWLGLASTAYAHGAVIVCADDNFGPYHMVVYSSPASETRQMLLTVILTEKTVDNPDPQPILGAKIQATFVLSSAKSSPLSFTIPTEAQLADQGYYESILAVPSEGDWQVRMRVDGSAGTALASFPISLRYAPTWAQWLEWLVPVAVIAFFYLLQKRRRPTADNAGNA